MLKTARLARKLLCINIVSMSEHALQAQLGLWAEEI